MLVRVPSWLGDAVACEPVLRALVAKELGALTLVGPGRLLELLDAGATGARRLPTEDPAHLRPAAWRGHDLALLLTGSFRSAWTALRAGIPERVGWSRDGRGALLTLGPRPALERGRTPLGLGRSGRSPRILPRPMGASATELASLVGLTVSDPRPRLAPGGAARAALDERLARAAVAGPLVVLNAGGRAGSTKAIEGELWRAVALELRRSVGATVVAVAGPGEEERAREAVHGVEAAIALVDPVPDLRECLALFERAALVLTSDTGLRHLAAAAGAPTVGVFSSTDPRHTTGVAARARAVREVVPCGPCHREVCPLEGDARLACLHALDPGAVAAAARALLEESPSPALLS